jgi:hypothetical protein
MGNPDLFAIIHAIYSMEPSLVNVSFPISMCSFERKNIFGGLPFAADINQYPFIFLFSITTIVELFISVE